MREDIFYNNDKVKEVIEENDFASAAKMLLEDQKKTWPQLTSGYESLNSIQVKTFQFDNFTIKVQFNPGRIVSSSAKVDAKSIKERKCFLCYDNLPAEQKGILYKNQYLILCNPFPIFPEHFTLPHIDHIPQSIKINFETLLDFSKDLSGRYTVFYNGPKCGASAPDHLHFQAGNKSFMPIDDDFHQLQNECGEVILENEELSVFGVDDGLRRFISIESSNKKEVIEAFNSLYDLYDALENKEEEPMMNILGFYEEEFGWRILVFLRDKHRPSHYFAEGGGNILLSPASVDLGGVCITPLEKDFNKITKELLTEIFKEISLAKEHFDYIKLSLKKKLS